MALSKYFLGKTLFPNFLFFRGFSSKLFVKGLSFSTTEEILSEELSQFGKVIEAKIVMDITRNRSKGFGYVSFAREEDAHKAFINMNGKLLDGRVVFVDKEVPKSHFKDRAQRERHSDK